jgi:hypothetical protein
MCPPRPSWSLYPTLHTLPHPSVSIQPLKWILPSTNVGLCCYLFYVSKYVELLDTAFLLLRNKPVRFVQKWHHVSVLYLFWSYMQVRERDREREKERESLCTNLIFQCRKVYTLRYKLLFT